MIEAKKVNFAYRRGTPVLNDIDCRIEDGEFVALLGHNGSGKTTLSRLFMALLHPRSGIVTVDGKDIEKKEPADLAESVGYVFQNPDLQILADTVWEEVAYGPKNKKLSEEKVAEQVNEALRVTGLTEFAGAYPRALSFGQKRRLGVAAALALKPKTLILDEITNGQDNLEKKQMMEYLQVINQEQGITVILITHDMNIARLYARRTIVLFNGELVFDGEPERLFGGAETLTEWGLELPSLAVVGNALGIAARTPRELCESLMPKAGEA